MRELPIYPGTSQDYGPVLAQERDRLLRIGASEPERLREAVQRLTLECATESLRLTGISVTLAEVTRISRDPSEATSPHYSLVLGQIRALEAIRVAARAHLSPDRVLIREVHRLSSPPDGGRYRREVMQPQFSGSTPSRPEIISHQIDNLVDWLAAGSVRGLHVSEKAALAFTRLLEIAPFERHNFRVAHLLMSFFAFQENFPPFFLRAQDADEVREDIERAVRFDTARLVTRLARAQLASLDFCLQVVQEGTAD